MNCTIRGVAQKIDFATNTMQNFLALELPTGETIQCLIDDAVAEKVVAAHTRAQVAPPTPTVQVEAFAEQYGTPAITRLPVVAHPRDDEPADDPEVTEFGGEDVDDGVPSV